MLWSKRSAQQIHQTTKAIVVPSSTGTTLIRTQKALKTRVLFTYFISISVVPKELGQQIHQLLNTIPVLSPTGKTLIWTQKNSKNPRFLQLLLLCQCFTRRDRHNKHIRLQMRALQGRHWFQLSKHSKHVLFLS